MTNRVDLVNLDTNRVHRVPEGGFTIGRGRDADLVVLDPELSRSQFRIFLQDGRYVLEVLSTTVPTYCDERVVEHTQSLEPGMQIQAGKTRFLVRFERHGTSSFKGEDDAHDGASAALKPFYPDNAQTYVGDAIESEGNFSDELTHAIPLDENVLIGRDPTAEVMLPHIQVSRKHARIYSRNQVPYLQDLGSANGTFIDGELVTTPVLLKRHSVIGIGPYSLTYLGDRLVPVSRVNNSQIEAHELTRRVTDKDQPGAEKSILDRVSLVIRPREFVCLLGPSGSGKSTLLLALSARTPADSGHVLINGGSLYDNFESLKSEIAVVPQRDILHEVLTVEEALRFTARLRLPADTTTEEIERQINDLLVSVGLAAIPFNKS